MLEDFGYLKTSFFVCEQGDDDQSDHLKLLPDYIKDPKISSSECLTFPNPTQFTAAFHGTGPNTLFIKILFLQSE